MPTLRPWPCPAHPESSLGELPSCLGTGDSSLDPHRPLPEDTRSVTNGSLLSLWLAVAPEACGGTMAVVRVRPCQGAGHRRPVGPLHLLLGPQGQPGRGCPSLTCAACSG